MTLGLLSSSNLNNSINCSVNITFLLPEEIASSLTIQSPNGHPMHKYQMKCIRVTTAARCWEQCRHFRWAVCPLPLWKSRKHVQLDSTDGTRLSLTRSLCRLELEIFHISWTMKQVLFAHSIIAWRQLRCRLRNGATNQLSLILLRSVQVSSQLPRQYISDWTDELIEALQPCG